MDQEQWTRSNGPGAGHQEQCVAPQAPIAARRRLCFQKPNNLSKDNLSKDNLSKTEPVKSRTCQKTNLSKHK